MDDDWTPVARFWGYVGAAQLIWIFVVVFDPLGSYSAITGESVSLFAQITAPFYGYSSNGKGQSETLVVLIKPHSDFGKPFPPNADTYASLVRLLLEAGASAVFFDTDFTELHQGGENMPSQIIESLSEDLQGIAKPERPTPILFSTNAADVDVQPQLAADVRQRLSGRVCVGHAVTRVGDDTSLYPLFQPTTKAAPSARDAAELGGCLPVIKRSGGDATRQDHYTAAFALYNLICTGKRCPSQRPDLYKRDLVLQWGLKPPLNARLGKACRDFDDTVLARTLVALRWLLHGSLQGVTEPLVQVCPYTEELPAGVFNNQFDLAARYVTGHVVFIGIRDTQDVTTTPLNRDMGKIFLHAMALDNLITYGPRYYQNPPAWEYKAAAWFVWLLISSRSAFRDAYRPKPEDAAPAKPSVWRRVSEFFFPTEPAGLFGLVQQVFLVPAGRLGLTAVLVGTLMFLNISIFRWRYNDLLLIALLFAFQADLAGRLRKVKRRKTLRPAAAGKGDPS